MSKSVRIGCGAGFWGDSQEGPAQLVMKGGVNYLVFDYLAEITMSILARVKARNPKAGYAPDFISHVLKPLAPEIARQGIRAVANAGGVNPEACGEAMRAMLKEAGISLKVAVITGDDLMDQAETLRAEGVREMFSGAPFPKKPVSMNAYLGAFPIAAALDAGADIVITGRCVDSAVVLGPLIHEFGWTAADFDRLSAGSLAGHILECGVQGTGGLITDWRDAADGWPDMGFPVAECFADGSFILGKPEGTGGVITPLTVSEQIVYEVGDPAAYLLPDVTCDWTDIQLAVAGENRVKITGARGRAPTNTYKVSATYADGFRCMATMMVVGREAAPRAEAVGNAILARAGKLLLQAGFAGFTETSVEVLGAETSYGDQARPRGDFREVIVKIAVSHESEQALRLFAREIYPAATAMAQSLTGFAGGRPEPQPVVRLFSFLHDKQRVKITLHLEDRNWPFAASLADGGMPHLNTASATSTAPLREAAYDGPMTQVPLIALACARSGDKGDTANIGVIARNPDFVAPIRNALTPEAVRRWFSHYVKGDVVRHDWPGLHGMNFVMQKALGGGGVASLRYDPQGKAMAQVLMDFPVPVPANWLQPAGPLAAFAAGRSA